MIEFLPTFMQSFGEMKQIMDAEEPQMRRIDEKTAGALDNAFLMECDETALHKYEALLGILPDSGDSLETRRIRVLVRWNDFLPYSFRALLRKLDAYCGAGNYELDTALEDYGITVHLHLRVPPITRTEVEHMLDRMLPLNMAFRIQIEWNRYRVFDGKWTYGQMSRYTYRQLRETVFDEE